MTQLKHGDNTDLAWKAWPAIQPFLHDRFEDVQLRSIYVMIASAISRSKMTHDGRASFGECMFLIARDQGSYSIRFRRMLASDSVEELLDVLRPLFRNFESHGVSISYAQLLTDLYWFRTDGGRERVKTKWAEDYLRRMREAGYVSDKMDLE